MYRHGFLLLVAVVAAGLAQDSPVATVDGEPFLESELDVKSQLVQLEPR